MNNSIIICDDTTKLTNDEWRAQRNIGLGGSDAAVAVGLSDYKSPLQLYNEKIAETLPEEKYSDAMWFGTKVEPIVAERFADEHPDYKVKEVNKILCHPKHKFMIANLDRTVELPDGREGVLELKTASEYQRDKWEDDAVPTNYVCQVQHYLAVTGAQFAWIAAIVGNGHYYERLINRDDEFISMLIEEENKFWDCVQNRKEPAWDGSNASENLIKEMYPVADQSKKVIISTEHLSVVHDYLKLKKQRQDIESTAKKIKSLENSKKEFLISLMGDAGYATIGDYEINRKMTQVEPHVVRAHVLPSFRIKGAA